MPVIVVGGDTPTGQSILEEIVEPGREVRAFVTDVEIGTKLKSLGVKVAVGDVSDESHVESASLRCFTAVLIAEAAHDDRERSFAATEELVLEGWASAVTSSNVTRVIWVHSGTPPAAQVRETAVVSPEDPELIQRVIDLDEAQIIKP
ncbi:MAG: NAD(P)H-binding protein [Acidimicrobiia bacterium]